MCDPYYSSVVLFHPVNNTRNDTALSLNNQNGTSVVQANVFKNNQKPDIGLTFASKPDVASSNKRQRGPEAMAMARIAGYRSNNVFLALQR